MRTTVIDRENMSSKAKTNRGRPATLTDSARKRNRKDVVAKYNKSQVNIGKEHDRWMSLKDQLNVGTHAEVAKVLLDRYESACSQNKRQKHNAESIPNADDIEDTTVWPTAATSTPAPSRAPMQLLPELSDISSSDHGNKFIESDMSGVEEMVNLKTDKSKSFNNPFDLSIEFTEENSGDCNEDVDEVDPDYEPSFNITISDANVLTAKMVMRRMRPMKERTCLTNLSPILDQEFLELRLQKM